MAYAKTAMKSLQEQDHVERFAKKYNAYIGESSRYRHRVTRPEPYQFHRDPHDYRYNFISDLYEEAYVEVHMPPASFEYIVNMDATTHMDVQRIKHADSVLQQHRADERVRDDNPAVQNAWNKYITLLELARK